MDKNIFEAWKGKKIFIITKAGRKYSGIIKETTENFIFLTDKFNEKVVISISEISSFEEEQ